jgi:hypothetical protein
LDERRVVRLRTPAFGSGYQVDADLVLTAAHVLRSGACEVLSSAGAWLPARVVARAPDLDLAVVQVAGLPPIEGPVRWGRLRGGASELRWDAIGFPVAGGREPEHAWGTVSPQTGTPGRRLGLTLSSRDARSSVDASGWAGLSGAAVFCGDVLIGVVTDDPAGFDNSLGAVRVAAIADHPDLHAALRSPAFEPVAADEAARHDRAVAWLTDTLRRHCDELPYLAIQDIAARGNRPVPPLSDIYIEQRQQERYAPSSDPRPGPAVLPLVAAGSAGMTASGLLPPIAPALGRPLSPAAGAAVGTVGTGAAGVVAAAAVAVVPAGVAVPPASSAFAPGRETAGQALGRHRHMLVEGRPGLGKSTLLHCLALEALDDGAVGVPVLVTARRLLAHGGDFAEALRQAAAEGLGMPVRRLPDDMFERPPAPGRTWLVLVDAVDEIIDGAGRKRLVEALRSAAAEPYLYRLVATSRPVPELDRFTTDLFGLYELQPFDDAQARAFVEGWFAVRSAQPAADVERFRAEVDRSRLGDLATTPLLITMAVLLYEQHGGGLPDSRLRLYEDFVDVLLADEETNRLTLERFVDGWRAHGDDGLRCAERLFAARIALVTALAEWQLDHDIEPPDAFLTAAAGQYIDDGKVPQSVRAPWLADQLTRLLARTGVVVRQAGELTFVHDTFREYFAARAITDANGPTGPAAKALLTQWQYRDMREILLFAIALWSRQLPNHDATPLLRQIWQPTRRRDRTARSRESLPVVAEALVEGIPADSQYRESVVDELVARSAEGRGDLALLARLAGTAGLLQVAERSRSDELRLQAIQHLHDRGDYERARAMAIAFGRECSTDGGGRQFDFLWVVSTLRSWGDVDDAAALLRRALARRTLTTATRLAALARLADMDPSYEPAAELEAIAADETMAPGDRLWGAALLARHRRGWSLDEARGLNRFSAATRPDLAGTDEVMGVLRSLAKTGGPGRSTGVRLESLRAIARTSGDDVRPGLRRIAGGPFTAPCCRLFAADALAALGELGPLRSIVADGLLDKTFADGMAAYEPVHEHVPTTSPLLRNWRRTGPMLSTDLPMSPDDQTNLAAAMLAAVDPSPSTIALLHRLAIRPERSDSARLQTAKVLAGLGDLDALHDLGRDERLGPAQISAGEVLAAHGRHEVLAGIAAEERRSSTDRLDAAARLARLGEAGPLGTLVRRDGGLELEDLREFAKRMGVEHVDVVLDLVENPAVPVARRMALALAVIDPSWNRLFEEPARSLIDRVRGRPAIERLIQEAVDDPGADPDERVVSADALIEIGRTDVAPMLLAIAGDPSVPVAVRSKAVRCLVRLRRIDDIVDLARGGRDAYLARAPVRSEVVKSLQQAAMVGGGAAAERRAAQRALHRVESERPGLLRRPDVALVAARFVVAAPVCVGLLAVPSVLLGWSVVPAVVLGAAFAARLVRRSSAWDSVIAARSSVRAAFRVLRVSRIRAWGYQIVPWWPVELVVEWGAVVLVAAVLGLLLPVGIAVAVPLVLAVVWNLLAALG